jgi:peptide methionine sulfoxide reductase msrA/msrB
MIMKDLHTNLGFGHGLTREVDTSRCESATFAGGCFWCMVEPFEGLEGVIKVISGYIGGYKENPTYEQVCSGTTGHYEAIQLTFDPGEISYETLLDIFWRQIDPTDTGGQFHDRGKSYRTAIFYHNEAQRQSAVDSRKELNQSCRFSAPIATLIIPATTFYPAEDYHQFYYRKSAARYLQYRSVSGRDHFLKAHWDTKRAGSNNNSINPDAEPQ